MHSPRSQHRPGRGKAAQRRGCGRLTPATIAITAAEPSGDLQGAALARSLRRMDSRLRLIGVGSRAMVEAGVDLFLDSSTWGAIGPFEAARRVPTVLRAYWKLRQTLLRERPDLIVVIDSPAIHYRIAGVARKAGLRCLYYFPPSQWTTSSRRLRQIHKRVDAVVTAFRFNAEQYRKLGLEVAYFGHPLVDVVGTPPSLEHAQRSLGLGSGAYVALMPGSRAHEVRLLLDLLLDTADLMLRVRPELNFLIPCATSALEETIRARLRPGQPVQVFSGRSREVMAASRLALMASGSASLEAALLGLPHVIFYRGNRLDWILYRLLTGLGLVRIEWFGLCNLILQQSVMPEFLQDDATPERLAGQGLALYADGPVRERMLADLARVRQSVGGPGVVDRVAALVLDMACGTPGRVAVSRACP